jgi:hypothetical protein
MSDNAHAELGASSASRWMNCPGSVRMSKGIKDTAGPAAHTGSAAHRLAEICLLESMDPWEFLGEPVPDKEYADIVVNEDIVAAVTAYVERCREIVRNPTKDNVEVRVALGAAAGGDTDSILHDMFGTADFIAKVDRKFYVADYKNGSGVLVEAAGNPQGRYYAVGGLLALGLTHDDIDEVEVGICQPNARRAEAWDTEVIPTTELMRWFDDELVPAAEATQDPDAPLNAGDWCKFCPAKATCPALADKSMADAMLEFAGDDVVAPQRLEALTPDDVRRILENRSAIEGWLKAVHEYAEQKALAGEDITNGAFVLKEGRKSRSWSDAEKAAKLAESWGIPKEKIYTEPEVRSVAQLEKAVGKSHKAELAKLIVETRGAKKLAPASSERKTLQAGAEADFDE